MSFQNRLAAATRKSAAASTIVDADDLNRRWARRKPSQTPAQIKFDGITVPFECVVRDISSTGAKLEMARTKFNPEASHEAIPNQFSLIIPLDRIVVDCLSMWRRGSKLGVKFMGAVRQLPPPPKPILRKSK
jgi:hypothetical protein